MKIKRSITEIRFNAPRRIGRCGGKSSKIKYKIDSEREINKLRNPSLDINPLENPEAFGVTLFCNKCKKYFKMSLIKRNELHRNSGYFKIENRAEEKLCSKCYKIYFLKEVKLKMERLLTDVEVGEMAEKITKAPYGWEYQLGFIDGYILCRDGEENILSENK